MGLKEIDELSYYQYYSMLWSIPEIEKLFNGDPKKQKSNPKKAMESMGVKMPNRRR